VCSSRDAFCISNVKEGALQCVVLQCVVSFSVAVWYGMFCVAEHCLLQCAPVGTHSVLATSKRVRCSVLCCSVVQHFLLQCGIWSRYD